MSLSNDLISQFVKITNDSQPPSSETTCYGTIVDYNGQHYVRLDGAPDELLTPVITLSEVKEGERVTVLIKDHTAIVTGNMSSPSVGDDARKVATDYIRETTDGFLVGDIQDSVIENNVLIRSEGVDIRYGDTVLSSFEANTITLGTPESFDSTILLCGGVGLISATQTYYDDIWRKELILNSERLVFDATYIDLETNTQFDPQFETESQSASYSSNGHMIIQSHQLQDSIYNWTSVKGIATHNQSSQEASYEAYADSGACHVLLSVKGSSDVGTGFAELVLNYEGITINRPINFLDDSYINQGSISGSDSIMSFSGSENYHFDSRIITESAVYSGGKTSYSDGVPGCMLNTAGRLYLTGKSGTAPGVFLYNEGSTSADAAMYIGTSNGYLSFGYAPGNYFSHKIVMANNVAFRSYDSSDTERHVIYLSENNNIIIGSSDADSAHDGDTRIYAKNGMVGLYGSSQNVYLTGDYFRPNTDGECTLGSTSYPWKKVYAASTSIGTSDKRMKSNISNITDNSDLYEKLFNGLIPKTYTLNSEDTNEIHFGFIAQDIVEVFEEIGLSEEDYGLVDHAYWTDNETGEERDRYGLGYTEFIALNTYMIQKLICRIDELEMKVREIYES